MSKYIVAETTYTCSETIKEALEDLGVPPAGIVVNIANNDIGQKEGLTVSAGNVSASFSKQDDGTYTIGMSDYFKNSATGKKLLAKAKGGTGELDQHYAKRAVLKAIAKNYGHKLKTCEAKNGKIQIKISVH